MIAGETSRSPADRAAVGPHQRGPARTGRKWTCAPARTCAAPGPALDRDRSRAGSTMPSRTGGDHRTVDAAAPCSTSIRPGLMRDAGTAERVSPAPAEQRQILHFRQLFGPIRLDSRRRAAISHASRRWGHLPRRIVFACRSAFGPRGLAGTTKLLSDLKPLSD